MPTGKSTTKKAAGRTKDAAIADLADHGLTVKQEKFVHAYLETGNASEAYCRAYDADGMKPSVVHVKASELLANGKVAVRFRALGQIAAQRAVITAETILGELEQARLLALEMQQPAAMVAASMGRARVAGLLIDKKEVGKPNEFKDMSDEELRNFIATEARSFGLEVAIPPMPATRTGNGTKH